MRAGARRAGLGPQLGAGWPHAGLAGRTPGAGRSAARPRLAKRVLASAAAGRCSSRAPPAGCTGPGVGSGSLSARRSGRVRGLRARRPPAAGDDREAGEGGGLVFREMQLIKSCSLIEERV